MATAVFAIVDTGTREPKDAAAIWHEVFAALPEGVAPTRVLVTHMHPTTWAWLAGSRAMACGCG